ncbi:MAG: hypothetical protein IPO21_21550 [Bacteroidales bacterium]|nr:hypothetical protein [Bacteroidales bacterium]
MNRFIIGTIAILSSFVLIAQEPNEGVFVDFEMFKANNPITKHQISIPENTSIQDFLVTANEKANLYYFDQFGLQNSIKVENIWGFYFNGIFYVRQGASFYRLHFLGAISLFTSRVMVESIVQDNSPYSPYGQNSLRTQYSYEDRNLLLDMNTGIAIESSVKNLEEMISKDTLLLNEFRNSKQNEKSNLIFYFIRRYNANHNIEFNN